MSEMLIGGFGRGVIQIDGVTDHSTFIKTAGVHEVIRNGREAIRFDGTSQLDYIRIPQGISPQPSFDDCHIYVEYEIDGANRFGPYSRILGKWVQTVGNGDLLFSDESPTQLTSSYGLYSENAASSYTKALPLEIISRQEYRKQGSLRRMFHNGVQSFNYDTGSVRKTNADWLLGTYQDAYGTPLTSTYATRFSWWLYKLRINFA